MPAFDAAGDPDRYPDAGEPWQPSKLYYTGFSFRRIRALHEAFLSGRRGEPVRRAIAQFEERRGSTDLRSRRRRRCVDVGDFLAPGARALLAHRTQVDPDGPLDAPARRRAAGGLPVGGVRARPLAGAGLAMPSADEPEDDLFAGVRADVR